MSSVGAIASNAIPAALPSIGTALALSETEIGLVMSFFSLPVIVMVPLTGIASDIYGRRIVVIPSLLLLGISGVGTLLVDSFLILLLLRMIQGAAFAGTLPLAATMVGDLYTGAQGSSAQGMRSGLNGLAGAFAPIVAGVVAAIAWQYPFLLFTLAFPVAGAVYLYYPEPIDRQHRGDGIHELISKLREYLLTLRTEATDRTLGLIMSGGFTLFALKQGFRTFLPVFVVQSFGSTTATVGTILGVYGGTRVLISPLAGSLVGRLGRKMTMLIGISSAALGVGMIPFASTLWWVGLAAAVYAGGEAILNPVINDSVAAFADDERRGGTMSVLQIVKNAALVVTPPILGVTLATTGFVTMFLLIAALAILWGIVLGLRFSPSGDTFAG